MQLQHNKAHYELQIQLIQDSCENRIRMIQEDRDNSARHFKEEKEILQNHINIIEKEKHDMSNVYKRKTEDSKSECDVEIEKLRQIQREAVENLKVEHESVLSRVKKFKDTELSAAMAASTHTRTIESVLNLIEDNTKNLDGLSQKVQMGHMMNINEHDIQIRNKEEQLKRNLNSQNFLSMHLMKKWRISVREKMIGSCVSFNLKLGFFFDLIEDWPKSGQVNWTNSK